MSELRYTDRQLRSLIRGANRDRNVGGNRVYGPVTPNDPMTIGRLAWELLEARKAGPAGRVLARVRWCDWAEEVCLIDCEKPSAVKTAQGCRHVEVREVRGGGA